MIGINLTIRKIQVHVECTLSTSKFTFHSELVPQQTVNLDCQTHTLSEMWICSTRFLLHDWGYTILVHNIRPFEPRVSLHLCLERWCITCNVHDSVAPCQVRLESLVGLYNLYTAFGVLPSGVPGISHSSGSMHQATCLYDWHKLDNSENPSARRVYTEHIQVYVPFWVGPTTNCQFRLSNTYSFWNVNLFYSLLVTRLKLYNFSTQHSTIWTVSLTALVSRSPLMIESSWQLPTCLQVFHCSSVILLCDWWRVV